MPPLVGMLVASAGVCLLVLRRHPNLTVVGLLLVAAGGGSVGSALRGREGAGFEAAVTGVMRCSVAGRVLEQAGGLGTLVALDAADCSGSRLPSGVAILSAAHPLPSGSNFTGEGWLIPLGSDEFARRRVSAGARAEFEPIEMRVEAARGAWSLVAAFRDGIARVSQEALPGRHAALLLGLTIGDTSGLSRRDMDLFRSSGLAHILAVSGSNVAIVLGAVAAATRRVSYRLRLLTVLAAAALFVGIVGPDASVLRAAAMGTVAFVAAGWVRPVDPLHSLPFALLVIVAARPWIVDSAGLHLSVAATAGIVLWSQPIGATLRRLPGAVAAPLAVTLAAQIAVAPVLILTFGTLPLVAPVANLLAAPAVVLATLVGMSAMLIAPVLGLPAGWLVVAAHPALAWLLWVAEACGAPAWSSLELPRGTGWVTLVAVSAAAAVTLRRRGSPAVVSAHGLPVGPP